MIKKFFKWLWISVLLFFATRWVYKGHVHFLFKSWLMNWLLIPMAFCLLTGFLVQLIFHYFKRKQTVKDNFLIGFSFALIVLFVKIITPIWSRPVLDFDLPGLLFLLDGIFSFQGITVFKTGFYSPGMTLVFKFLMFIMISVLIVCLVKIGIRIGRHLRASRGEHEKIKIPWRKGLTPGVLVIVFVVFFFLEEQRIVSPCPQDVPEARALCQMSHALRTRNLSYCPSDGPSADLCQRYVHQNVLPCMFVPVSERRKCLAFIKLDHESCMSLSGFEQKECVLLVANLRGDARICETLITVDDKVECYQKRCELLNDASFCERRDELVKMFQAGAPLHKHYKRKIGYYNTGQISVGQDLYLNVTLDRSRFDPGQPITGNVVFVNDTDQQIFFSGSLLISRGPSLKLSDQLIALNAEWSQTTVPPRFQLKTEWSFHPDEVNYLARRPGENQYVFWILSPDFPDGIYSQPVVIKISEPLGGDN